MNKGSEHLLVGQLGHFLVVLSAIFSLLSLVAFVYASQTKNPDSKLLWQRYGRSVFIFQTITVLASFLCLFYICYNHLYEYQYAFKHTSDDLETKYLFACIWEGQEGSFLLWIIWQAVLGSVILTRKSQEWRVTWQTPVMAVIALSQFCLLLMILGVYIGDTRIGNSPFLFSGPENLGEVPKGLNVLLRNYWMVIHPPVLFLGFASTVIPFALAIAGLYTNKHTGWVKMALPWTLFSMCVLGVGIMMGAKWAYESLSFGGYWAWDPVENASLVPWLFILAGLHTMLIFKATGRSLKATYLFLLLGFLFVLYSTFLTRTGILGEASVHAFTDAGKTINLMILGFMLLFMMSSISLFVFKLKKIPSIKTEEEMSSREFWMFTGSLVIFMSGIFVIIITSIPVFDKIPILGKIIRSIHKGPLALPEDPEYLYNKVMIMVAIIMGLLTAATQYLKYKKTALSFKLMMTPLAIALLLSAIICWLYPLEFYKKGNGFLLSLYLGLTSMIYAVTANAMYIADGFKFRLKLAGSSISHIGFALMILGMIISSANKKVISDSTVNHITLDLGEDPITHKKDNPKENLTLPKNTTTSMDNYLVTYKSNSRETKEKSRVFYTMHFEELDRKTGKKISEFELKPDVYLMKNSGMSSNPDTKHYLTKDIFTYISALPNQTSTDLPDYDPFIISKDKVAPFKNLGNFSLDSITVSANKIDSSSEFVDTIITANITFNRADNVKFHLHPKIKLYKSKKQSGVADSIRSMDMNIVLSSVNPDGSIKFSVIEKSTVKDFITVKTYVFPYINLVWFGLIIMAMGIFISMMHRWDIKGPFMMVATLFFFIAIAYMFLFAR